jgi:hypothetical protein
MDPPLPLRMGALPWAVYPSRLREELRTIDLFIMRWASRKNKRFQGTRWRHGTGCVRSSGTTRTCSPTGPLDQRPDVGAG